MVALLLAVTTDVIVLSSRIRNVEIAMPATKDAIDTWVIVSSDSRSSLPGGSPPDQFGTPSEVPGARADLILFVAEYADKTDVVSIPRDLSFDRPRHQPLRSLRFVVSRRSRE